MGQADSLMATIDLPYVQRFRDRHGKVRHYFRKPGCKRTALPGLPGSAEFMEAYKIALGQPYQAGTNKVTPGSISALIAAYYESDHWTSLKPQTRAVYRNVLERFRKEYGAGPAKQLQAAHINRILDKMADRPGAASNLLKRLRGLFAFALERRLVTSDPTADVKRRKPRKTAGFRPWTDGDVEAFLKHWPDGSRARLALYLLLYTGQRRSDVVRMGRQHVRGGVLHVIQQKTGAELQIPLHPVLKTALDELPRTNLTFLMTAQGKPFTGPGFTNWFVECAKAAGLPERSGPHGLRKAAGRVLAEAGCTAHEIMAITGHESLKEVERYTKTARQAVLARSAMGRMANSGGQT